MPTGGASQRADALADDRALLERFRAGDRDALARVYDAHVGDVAAVARYGFSLSDGRRVPGLRDREQQRDLVQEVFVRAFEHRARQGYDGLRPYRPYLLRIAKNVMIDRARRASVRGEDEAGLGDLDEIIARNLTLEPAPEQDLTWRRRREATVAFLAGQTDEVRRFVELRFGDEGSQAEVARALGVTRRRVRTLEARVLRGLRRELRRLALAE